MRPLRSFGFLAKLTITALLLCLDARPAMAQPSEPPPALTLADRIDAILARDGVARGFWGVEIEELDSGRVLYSRDADRLFAPASNAKLFTTAAALALLGPDYTIHTTIEASAGPDKYGRVAGDLVLVGRGDANLSGRELPFHIKTERPYPPAHVIDELADKLVAAGVKVVDGDIVGDDSYFANEPFDDGWSEEDVTSLWGAPVSALAVNDDVVFLNVLPATRVAEHAFVSFAPFTDYYRIVNRVLTTPPATGPHNISIQRRPGEHIIELTGTIPLDDAGYGEALAVDDPAEWSAHLLRDALVRRGVSIYGGARAHHRDPNEQQAKAGADSIRSSAGSSARMVLAEHLSPPLSVDLQVTNKVSQNLHAEMLLRLLGREKGRDGSAAAGLEVLRGFLALAGVVPEEYAFSDGCGLSRHDLVTPRATVKLLRYAARQSWGAEFIDSLPQAGVDGTLASRLQTLPAGAVLHAKTGSLEHVNVLSGYLTTAAGRHLVFSIMANNFNLAGRQAAGVIDEIVVEAERAAD